MNMRDAWERSPPKREHAISKAHAMHCQLVSVWGNVDDDDLSYDALKRVLA